jgi:cytochrome c oxidase subunit 3/cytochrome o ubiquinol oxidase subunit 3
LPPAKRLEPLHVGMICFLTSEVAFFSTLIVAYIFFMRQTVHSSPSPAEVFRLPMVVTATILLLLSSVTIHLAEKALHRSSLPGFLLFLGLTIILGASFLVGTALEWTELIGKYHLTLSRNMFGTTYFTLVGFHALHVTIGLIVMSIVFGLYLGRQTTVGHHTGVTVISWYWHFVDGVWIVVFSLVYIVGR